MYKHLFDTCDSSQDMITLKGDVTIQCLTVICERGIASVEVDLGICDVVELRDALDNFIWECNNGR